MGSIFLFNPDHDLALANNDANYMPPAAARQLAADLALLPIWYGGGDDFVLAPTKYNKAFLDEQRTFFHTLPSLLTLSELADKPHRLSPWGWNPAVHKKFLECGVSSDVLPSLAKLELIRQYSNRLQAVRLLPKLNKDTHYCGESSYLTEMDSIRHLVENHANCVLKAPLSGSGKGLNWCKGQFTFHIERWCDNILKQQGGVIFEPLYNKVVDFAMQFQADANGKLAFTGYSLFQTNSSGAYVGNIIASDAEIEKELTTYVPIEALEQVKEQIIGELSGVYADVYSGYLGVDMMVCSFPESPDYKIHPCVEINLRMTMGMVSRLLCDKYVYPGKTGVYHVGYYASPEELKKAALKLAEEFPAEYSNGKMYNGYFPLVPVSPVSRYHAWVQVG